MKHSAEATALNSAGKELRRRRAKATTTKSPDDPVQSASDSDPAAKNKTPVIAPGILSTNVSLLDVLIMTCLLALAVAVRFYRLDAIQSVIFDEVHYLNFDNNILTGKYFFDVNPVFGKMAIAYIARAIGYNPDTPALELGQPLESSLQAFAARAPAAIFGAITVPVFYRVCRLLRLTTYASVVGAFFILFDSMHVIQSRICMVDSVLVFFTCLSMMLALQMWDAKNVIVIRSRFVRFADVLRMFLLLIFTGISCGLTASVRWTAFATPALIFTISLFGVGPFCKEPLHLIEIFILYSSAFVGYCGSFAVFLLNMNQSGSGDGFMSQSFQACLEGSKFYTGPEGCTMSMWARIVELNKTIFRYSKGIRGNDKWGSSWFQWIFNWRGALYYRQNLGDDIAMIYVLMNPVMTFCINALMGIFVLALFYTVRYRKFVHTTEALKQHLRRGSALFFAWVGSMVPTMVIYRSGPLYQYLPGLFFAQALGAVGFDFIPRNMRPMASCIITCGMVAAFVYWSPWVYGTPLSQVEHLRRRWLPRWD